MIQKVRSVTLKRKWLWCCLVILLLFPAVVTADVAYEGKSYPEDAEYIDLGDLVVRDFDGLIGFLEQMPGLRRVDMWQTKMDREHCDLLASRFPDIQWGWTLVIKSPDHEHLIRTDYTSWSTLHNNSSSHHSSDHILITFHPRLRSIAGCSISRVEVEAPVLTEEPSISIPRQ